MNLPEGQFQKVVVYLNLDKYKTIATSTFVVMNYGKIVDDGGELIILAPGVDRFSDDPEEGQIISKYGFIGFESIKMLTSSNNDLKNNSPLIDLLINGSSEGRFQIIYCTGGLSKTDIEGIGYAYGDIREKMFIYNPEKLNIGLNTFRCGTQIYFIMDPLKI